MSNRLTRGLALVGSLASDFGIVIGAMGSTANDAATKGYVDGKFSVAPVTITAATYAVGASDTNLIANYAGTVTLTLPAASTNTGRTIQVKTIQAQTVVSATSNVAPAGSATPGTAVLAGTAGKFAELVSDGTNWIVMESN